METNSTLIFWLVTVAMAVAAYTFIASPLIRRRSWGAVAAVAIAFPALSVGLYFALGSPSMPGGNSGHVQRTPAMPQPSGDQAGSVASLVDGLAARLQANPDDGAGWLLLARSYNHLNRPADAIAAYEKASALGQSDAKLAALLESGPSTAGNSVQIFGNVSLSDEAKEIVLPEDTVFIFARAIDGPKMPLAVLQRPASELPIDFALNDSQSMTDEFRLSMFDRVVVTARISRSGIATDALQGLEARSDDLVVSDNKHLNLIIGSKN